MQEGQTQLKIRIGGDFAPLPVDKYTIQVSEIKVVRQPNFNKTGEEDVFQFKFIVLDDKQIPVAEGEEAQSTRGRFLFKNFTPALSPRSWLFKLASAIAGHELSKEEMEKFTVESTLGRQVDVLINQTVGTGKNAGKKFANITAFSQNTTPLQPMSDEEIQKAGPTIQKASTPAIAPAAAVDPEAFIAQVEAESKPAQSAAELEAEAAELEAAAARARANAAKAAAAQK